MFDTVECHLCPHHCRLRPGEVGRCRVRMNLDGRLVALTYGRPVALHVDPVEKKPLFHFLPGAPVFSLATVGCNLHCVHCQNWEISQANPEDVEAYRVPPEKVAELAVEQGCRAVAYTYTEPIVYYEYTRDSALACRGRGLKNILVTAAYAEPEPFRQLCRVVDGAIIDLKAFSDRHYREICGGSLEPVLQSLRIAVEEGVWVEVLNLVVPTLNDAPEMLDRLIAFVRDELGADVPLHFTAFHPAYRLRNLPPTPQLTLERARRRALDAGLHYVYVGNVLRSQGENTYCPSCGELLVERVGYRILKNVLSGPGEPGVCPRCGARIAGVWA